MVTSWASSLIYVPNDSPRLLMIDAISKSPAPNGHDYDQRAKTLEYNCTQLYPYERAPASPKRGILRIIESD
jgi:hypothetical protein